MIDAMEFCKAYRPRAHWVAAMVAACLLARVAAAEAIAEPTGLTAAALGELLREQRGQVVLLNFWATWCRPCLKEIPALMDLQERYSAQGLVLVPVSLDDPGTAAQVVGEFLGQWFPGFHSWFGLETEMDAMVSVVDHAWNEVLPTSYVLDRQGRIRQRLQGGKPAEEFETVVRAALDQ